MGETVDRATREVRIGVVLYGGLSLAVYMNGVVQELLRVARATAAGGGADRSLLVADGELKGSEQVYREIGRRLRAGTLHDGPGEAVHTRFVVDLIAGTSAGGINGVFLAKALVRDLSLDALSDLWVDEGDIDLLLNDRRSERDLTALGMRRRRVTTSVLNSRRMTTKLLDALRRLTPRDGRAGPAERSPYTPALDLFVTATDLVGRTDVVPTADDPAGPVTETTNRVLFQFRYDEDADHFTDAYDAMLAFAARATSSFPVAFEPVRLRDLDEVIAAVVPDPAGRPYGSESEELRRFFLGYGDGYADVALADGGYLDNKPFDPILATLPHRRADLPVDRVILYVEPDPGPSRFAVPAGRPGDPPPPRPDALAAALAALSLPRNETIRAEVARIVSFGAAAARRQSAYDALAAALEQALAGATTRAARYGTGDPLARVMGPDDLARAMEALDDLRSDHAPVADERAHETLARLLAVDDPTATAHRTVRVRRVEREVAQALAAVLPAVPRSGETAFEDDLASFVGLARTGGPRWMADDDEWLRRFDLTFHLRRINHLQAMARQRLDGLDPTHEVATDLVALRGALDVQYQTLRQRGRSVRRPVSATGERPVAAAAAHLAERLRAGGSAVDSGRFDPQAAASALGDPATRAAFDGLLDAMARHVDLAGSAAATFASLVVPHDRPTARALRTRWSLYAFFDEIAEAYRDVLPGEANGIRVMRVSPYDADGIVTDLARRAQKLAGNAIHHFGAFFDADWRTADILWGRLDGAERIVEAIVPEGADRAERDLLVRRAQDAILDEALRDARTRAVIERTIGRPATSVDEVRAALATDPTPPSTRTTQQWLDLGARAARVANAVATDLSVGGTGRAPAVTAVGRVLKLGANLVELVATNDLKRTYLRNALVLVVASGVVMGLGGVLFRDGGLARAGFLVATGALVTRVVLDALADRLAGRDARARSVVRVTGIVLAVLAVAGALALWENTGGPWPLAVALGAAAAAVGLVVVANRAARPWLVGTVVLGALLVALGVYGVLEWRAVAAFLGWERTG